jgi:hypothetical protein
VNELKYGDELIAEVLFECTHSSGSGAWKLPYTRIDSKDFISVKAEVRLALPASSISGADALHKIIKLDSSRRDTYSEI